MNLSSGYPYSLIRTGLPYDYPKLLENSRADIVIMGGGISGALTAFYLQKAGVDCMLIDGRTLGLGSTCASTSLLQYEIDKPLFRLQEQIGSAKAQRAYHLSGDAIKDLESITREISFPDFQWKNSIYFAASKKDIPLLKKEFIARQQSGFDVSWMDDTLLKKTYGLLAPAAIVSALGAQTNAYSLTHALHQYHCKKGMRVYDRTQIVKIVHTKTGVSLLTQEGYSIRCKKLVYATGYESIRYIDKKIVALAATYATISEQFNSQTQLWKDEAILWNTADPYLYIRTTADRRILVGGRDEDFISHLKRDALIPAKSRQLQKDFKKHFPDIPFKKEFSWTGIFGSTKDGLPFIGNYPKLPNSLFALGFGGNGITFSVLAARILTAGIVKKQDPDASLFSFERI